MSASPKTIQPTLTVAEALKLFEQYAITSLFVVEDETAGVPVGIVHVHDLLPLSL